ncbi:MAG: SDR family oxidoreductase [Thermoanaerobaculia bacterium]
MHLVAGATGILGFEVCRLLVAKEKRVRAIVRESSSPEKVQALEQLGVRIVRGDLKDSASLDAACQGITKVISTASSTRSRSTGDSIETVDEQGQLNLIDAAAAAGVSHFVLVSFPPLEPDFPLQSAKRRVEDSLRKSGITYTILQPTMFMEVWLGPALGFDVRAGAVRVYGSGTNPISWISFHDVAQSAVAALERPEARNATIPLGGPEALSPNDVVALAERETGRKLEIQHVPEEALRQQYEAAADSMSRSFAGLMLGYASGQPIDRADARRRLGIEQLTSVREYLRTQV